MLRLYQHRVNTLADLSALVASSPSSMPGTNDAPGPLGIELDLRSDGDRVIVVHDPFADGPTIEEFLPKVGRRPCIFNVKCEGIEERLLSVAARVGIDDFFLLDLSVPAAHKLAQKGERRIAVRYSEVEPIEAALAWAERLDWVWVDCFTRFPGDAADWARLARTFKLCLVSPELQGHTGGRAEALRSSISDRTYHAVCTKHPATWVRPRILA